MLFQIIGSLGWCIPALFGVKYIYNKIKQQDLYKDILINGIKLPAIADSNWKRINNLTYKNGNITVSYHEYNDSYLGWRCVPQWISIGETHIGRLVPEGNEIKIMDANDKYCNRIRNYHERRYIQDSILNHNLLED